MIYYFSPLSKSKVLKRDLTDYHTWKLESGSVPIASIANSNGSVSFKLNPFINRHVCRDGAYWLIEKEKSLQLYATKDKELELVLQDVVESSWKEDHWKVLRKQQEKSDSKNNFEKKIVKWYS